MPIQRNSDQKSRTLEEFYVDIAEGGRFDDVAVSAEMLAFLKLVNQTFEETLLWGLTSHARLVIQNADDFKADWLVIVRSNWVGGYHFDYLLPEGKQPWPNATVHGEAKTLDEAKKYLLISMKESGGWEANDESKRLLEEAGL